ncbi:MAG: MBL fold metallo-hydrolase [Leptospirales bacterium]|nr:MBL fold metallo-hydrolase [Leptospirales bacterium]
MDDQMRIKLWGVRGSLPTPMSSQEYQSILSRALEDARRQFEEEPGRSVDQIFAQIPDHLKHVIGGETTCVGVDYKQTALLIDLGTGSRKAGEALAKRADLKDIHILITHTHWDHIQGFPFFAPAMNPEMTLHFYSCVPDLQTRLIRQQHPDHHNIRFEDLPCRTRFTTVKEGEPFQVGELKISAQPLIHPGGSTSYRMEKGNQKFVFATDTEFYGPELSMLVKKYDEFFHKSDLLIIDAQYSLPEAELKRGWGHTAMTIAVDCAMHWDIGRLGLTHHEPSHSDDTVRELFARAKEYLEANNPHQHPMELYLAREGDEYLL